MKIGVIDSGIGGLSVLTSLINKYPNHEYIYFGDSIHLPYGSKTREKIVQYANDIIKFLEMEDVELIVIACGTISSHIEYIKSNAQLIDLISPIKGKLDNYKKISVMATPLSIKTNAFKKYIKTNLNLISCPGLVPIIESSDYSDLDKLLKKYLKCAEDSDALVLGCTHYPIIKDCIKKHFKKDIICLDSFVVDKLGDLKESNFSLKLYFSKIDDVLVKNVQNILNREIFDKEKILTLYFFEHRIS